MNQRVAIVGSRNFRSADAVRAFVRALPVGSVVVSGGALGVDRWAEETGLQCGFQVRVHEADWNQHGRSAGPIRNLQIVEDCDRLVAFWDRSSRGTLNAICLAWMRGIPVTIFDTDSASIALEDALELASANGVLERIKRATPC